MSWLAVYFEFPERNRHLYLQEGLRGDRRPLFSVYRGERMVSTNLRHEYNFKMFKQKCMEKVTISPHRPTYNFFGTYIF